MKRERNDGGKRDSAEAMSWQNLLKKKNWDESNRGG